MRHGAGANAIPHRDMATIGRSDRLFRFGLKTDMRFEPTLAATAAAVAMSAMQAAAADPRCLAQGETFDIGQYACLDVGERGRLALCETAEGAMNWRTVQDHCPDSEADRAPRAKESANCLANAQSFGAGKFACLSVDGSRYLARCDLVLNTSSWTRVENDCPGNPPLNVQQETDDGSWKALRKPRELLDRLFGGPRS